jgi:hypothetical protein
MAKQLNDKHTKAEMLQAYNDLLKELQNLAKDKKNLETEVSRLAKQATTQATVLVTSPNNNANTQSNNQKMPEKYQVEDIIHVFEQIKDGFGNAGSDLSGKLTKEAGELAEIQKQIIAIENYVKELHNIESIHENTLPNLVEEYNEKAKLFAKEIQEQEENVGKLWDEKQKAWNKNKEEYELRLRERNANLLKERKRENDSYLYKIEQERKLAKDVFEQEKKKWYDTLQENKENTEKELEEKEKTLALQEKEYADTQSKAEELPDKLEKELKKVKEETKGAIRRNYEVQANLLAKDAEGLRRVNELKIKALEDNLAQQNEQVKNVRAELADMLKQAKELAIKALEGTANGKSFDAMREIALEQAKQQKQK